jgi:hypothetical protein
VWAVAFQWTLRRLSPAAIAAHAGHARRVFQQPLRGAQPAKGRAAGQPKFLQRHDLGIDDQRVGGALFPARADKAKEIAGLQPQGTDGEVAAMFAEQTVFVHSQRAGADAGDQTIVVLILEVQRHSFLQLHPGQRQPAAVVQLQLHGQPFIGEGASRHLSGNDQARQRMAQPEVAEHPYPAHHIDEIVGPVHAQQRGHGKEND